jgi:hypothetical protein
MQLLYRLERTTLPLQRSALRPTVLVSHRGSEHRLRQGHSRLRVLYVGRPNSRSVLVLPVPASQCLSLGFSVFVDRSQSCFFRWQMTDESAPNEAMLENFTFTGKRDLSYQPISFIPSIRGCFLISACSTFGKYLELDSAST